MGFAVFAFGSDLRELKEEMNSITCGESPSMLLKCSAASFLERVEAYSNTCCSSESGSGRSLESCDNDILVVDYGCVWLLCGGR